MWRNALLLFSFVLLGLADFIFNGVIVKWVFKATFKEQWMFIYAPLFIALAGTIYSYLDDSKWKQVATLGAVFFIVGTAMGHLFFVGHKSTKIYKMILLSKSPYILLHSKAWPQILFLDGEPMQKTLERSQANDEISVLTDFVTDYGCIRSAAIQTVADFNVRDDIKTTWTWRRNRFARTNDKDGPGMEDIVYPWCSHNVTAKIIEDGPPFARPWDQLLEQEEEALFNHGEQKPL